MNNCTIIGNLTKDPEIRSTQNGKTVCNFTVAVNKRFGDGATFFSVAAWGKLAENCKTYLAKGRKVAVKGEVSARAYDANGEPRAVLELNAEEVEFLSSPKQKDDDLDFGDFDDAKAPWED